MIVHPFFTFILLALLLIDSSLGAEIEYFWSGGVTNNSAVISFASDREAKIKIQYSDNKNFKKNTVYTKRTLSSEESNYFSKREIIGLKPNQDYYYRFNVDGVVDKKQVGKFRTHNIGAFSYKITLATCANTGSNNPVLIEFVKRSHCFI